MRLDSKSDTILPLNNKVDFRAKAFWRKALPIIYMVVLVASLSVLSTIFWNMTTLRYHALLETDIVAKTPEQFEAQNESFKSSFTWIVIYFWRLFNPHGLSQYILLAILYNKTYEYFVVMRYWGFLPIIFLPLLSYIDARVMLANILSA